MQKLQRLGLLENRRGEYFLIEKVKVGFLKLFIEMGGLLLPRYLFYAVFFTAMLLTYLLVYPQTLSGHNLISLMFGSIACLILWIETIRIRREAPF